jgi:Family of unknown function (DUF6011)
MQSIDALRENLARLTESDQAFASSLLDQAHSRGLTAKQVGWVDKLVRKATAPRPEPVNVAPIIDFLHDANIKRPRLVLSAGDQDIRLSIAGPSSRTPGYVIVTSPERAFSERRFLGRIGPDGVFEPSLTVDPEAQTAIVAALQAMALDPAGTAAAYGKLMGSCCFCGLPLSDGKSLAVGYGKTCAQKYNLPYNVRA